MSPAGYDFTDATVSRGAALKLFSNDIQDMYPAFSSRRPRALSNAIAIEIPLAQLAHLKAAEYPQAPRSGWVVPCVGGLVQGVLNAVDIASEAHASG